ncbi:uncharacterized protein LOC116200170 isoform X3 [Punica granatum]|uniref:Uncharacterized protein LOC116200170 isoform X3 n=1 Tax=Punica granatum TaxID=22663 RepID=A0A6P8D630_PUNGR|nr:uncharacterized protein LOC116200170 isoform X3 [Punica granatum]
MLLPDDWHSPCNLQESSSVPVTGNCNGIFDDGFLWFLDESGTVYKHHQQEYYFKSKQAATRWFKLKAVLQWAILRRIIMRKRARRMVLKSRVAKRLVSTAGQNWNVKEHKPGPVTSPTQMYFTCNHEHEDDEKDGKLNPIYSSDRDTVPSKLDTSGIGQSLTLFPTLLTGDVIEAEEVLSPHMAPQMSPIKATKQVCHRRVHRKPPPVSSSPLPETIFSNSGFCRAASSAIKELIMVRKKDPFWQYVEPVAEGRFKCNYCGRDFAGGIPRVKSHLSGIKGRDIDICLKVHEDVQAAAREAINGVKRKQKAEASSDDVQISALDATNGTNKRSKVEACSGNFDDNFSNAHEKKDGCMLDNLLAKFALLNDIDCNIIQSSSFIEFVNALLEFGYSYNLPSCSKLKTKLIPNLGMEVAAYVKNVKSSWEQTGCTLISDIWCDDIEGKFHINIISQCPAGLVLLGTFEVSKNDLSSTYFKEIISFVIQHIGPQRVLQFIQSDAQQVELPGPLLHKGFNHIFMTHCAACEIQLLFGDIYTGIEWVRATFDRANFVVDVVYEHYAVLSLVRKYTNKKELKQPLLTEFSSNYEMLQSFVEVKDQLLLLVKSSEWYTSDCDAEETRRQIAETIQNENFWDQVQEVLKALESIFHVFCLVDSSGSTFGYLYGAMEMAEEAMEQLYNNNPNRFQKLWDTFNSRKGRLMHPMHAAAAFLNPAFMCSETFKHSPRIKDGMNFVLKNLVADEEEDDFLDQMDQYHMKASEVFTYTAMKMLKTSHPRKWWDYCGDYLPILKKYAIRILSQPCSSSSCKRSLSASEAAQIKRRRESTPAGLENCLHLRMNATLMAKSNTMKTIDRRPIDLQELGKPKLISENSADGLPSDPKILCPNEQQNSGSLFTRNQLVEPNYLQLHFVTMVSSPLVTGQKVEGEGGSPIHVFLVDPQTGFLVQDGALSRLKLIVCVLEGDFNEEGEADWAQEYFQSNEITSIIPLMAGNLHVVLNGGMGTLGDITFNEESSMARNGTFRLGVKTSGDCREGFRIREGISNAFVVKGNEATRWKKPAAYDMLLPDDRHSPCNLQESSSFLVTGNYDEIYDDWLLWSFDESGSVYQHHQQEYCFKSKQAATRWFKLKAVLQWAILRRIIMRKRARRMVVKNRVEKRLGQNWNVKEHKHAPVTSLTQMYFTCNHEHEDDEKDGKLKPINSSDRDTVPSMLDTSGMGQSLTLFPTLLTGDGIKAKEVLSPHMAHFKATKQKGKEVLLKRSGSFRSTITDAGGSIPAKPDSNYFSHSLTLFPSLLNDMEPNKADVLEPMPTNSGSYIELTKLAPMAALSSALCLLSNVRQPAESSSCLTALDDGALGQCKYENDMKRAKKRWRKLKSVLRLVFLWKVIAPRSFEGHSKGSQVGNFPAKVHSSAVSRRVHRYVRRKDTSWTLVMGSLEDAYAWRKYGQKAILGQKYPRSYFRCQNRKISKCRATKQVERLDSDPTTYRVTYYGHHTCDMSAAVSSPSQPSPPPSGPEVEMPKSPPTKRISQASGIKCDDHKESTDQTAVNMSNLGDDMEDTLADHPL